jgi:hypothetical protein
MSERDFKNTPTDVLEKILGQGTIEHNPAVYELQRRLAKPHWTLLPTFWLVVASVIIALAALFLALRADIRAIRSSTEPVPVAPKSPTSERARPPEPAKLPAVPSGAKP